MKWKVKTKKYNNTPSVRDDMKFSSIAEAEYYDKLKIMKIAGEISFFLRQVPMHLPGGIKYVVDFLVFYSDGNIEFVDVKGMRTPTYILKKKQVEALYPIEIIEVKFNG